MAEVRSPGLRRGILIRWRPCVAFLDELAALIEQIEVIIDRGTQGVLSRLIAENGASTRRIMEGIGTILHDVGMAGEAPEVADQVRELAFTRLTAWSSTSPVFYHVRNTPRAEFNNFEIALLLLEHRLGGGNTAAQILDDLLPEYGDVQLVPQPLHPSRRTSRG